jgi:hypothetical protein
MDNGVLRVKSGKKRELHTHTHTHKHTHKSTLYIPVPTHALTCHHERLAHAVHAQKAIHLRELTHRIRGHPPEQCDVETRPVLQAEECSVDPNATGEGNLAGQHLYLYIYVCVCVCVCVLFGFVWGGGECGGRSKGWGRWEGGTGRRARPEGARWLVVMAWRSSLF